jgi:hypothetical protein
MGKPSLRLAVTAVLLVCCSAAASATAAPAASALPKACPSKAVVQRTIHLTVRRVVSRKRPIVSVSQTGGFGAPSASSGKSSGSERTCTYTTSGAVPVTITFSTPVTASVFAAARKANAHSAPVVVVHGVGDSAWATKSGGQLFVLKGTLDVAISAQGVGAVELAALARATV